MDPRGTTSTSEANGIGIHYVRHGSGFPLVLLHGWPEFWYTWRKNIPVLAGEFDVVAPDLRGFGDTDKPGLPDPRKKLLGDFVEDLRALADALGFEKFGVVSHDVGAYVAQGFARKYPERLSGLFFFDCPYPGIGRRWASPDSINEIWYQTFNQQPWAVSLVGENRKTCEVYIRHFLDHWSHAGSLRRGPRPLGGELHEAWQSAGRVRLVHQHERIEVGSHPQRSA